MTYIYLGKYKWNYITLSNFPDTLKNYLFSAYLNLYPFLPPVYTTMCNGNGNDVFWGFGHTTEFHFKINYLFPLYFLTTFRTLSEEVGIPGIYMLLSHHNITPPPYLIMCLILKILIESDRDSILVYIYEIIDMIVALL